MSDLNHVHANELEDVIVNPSQNPSFEEIVQVASSRRGFLKTGAGAAAAAFVGVPALLNSREAQAAAAAGSSVTLGFASVPMPPAAALRDTVVVPPGYSANVLYAWGDAIGKAGYAAGYPAWVGDASEGEAEQNLQSGAHHDGKHAFRLRDRNDRAAVRSLEAASGQSRLCRRTGGCQHWTDGVQPECGYPDPGDPRGQRYLPASVRPAGEVTRCLPQGFVLPLRGSVVIASAAQR